MKPSFNLFTIFGIKVGVHFTWFIILFLFIFTLSNFFLPGYAETNSIQWQTWLVWLGGSTAAILVFVSLLLHEFAHSLMAKRYGIGVKGITLFILGGVSNLARDSKNPSEEFSIAVVGPLTSAIIGGICWALYAFVFVEPSLMRVITLIIMQVNFIIAIFNLLPGFPLDGGRIFKAILWGYTNNQDKATNIAALGGQILGFALIVLGVTIFFTADNTPVNGLWLSIVGLFLLSSAGSQKSYIGIKNKLGDTLVARIMNRNFKMFHANTSAGEVIEQHFVREGNRAAIVAKNEEILGIVTVKDFVNQPRDRRNSLLLQDIMTVDTKTVEPGSLLIDAFKIMVENNINQLPVCIGNRIVGIIEKQHIIQYIRTIDQVGIR